MSGEHLSSENLKCEHLSCEHWSCEDVRLHAHGAVAGAGSWAELHYSARLGNTFIISAIMLDPDVSLAHLSPSFL